MKTPENIGEDLFEGLSDGKKGTSMQIRNLIKGGNLTKEELGELKYLKINEKDILEHLVFFKYLLKLVRDYIFEIDDIKIIISNSISNGRISKEILQARLKCFYDLESLSTSVKLKILNITDS